MNYLAHAYLSFNDPGILVGNMISDFVKGRKQYDYPEAIQKGIRLHRLIDSFTDQHPATREAKSIFKPAVGAYAGAFIDVVYDHFLAKDEAELAEPELQRFAEQVYAQLTDHHHLLPEKFAGMLPYMRTQNWLYHYRSEYGIEKSFGGLVRRAAGTSAFAADVTKVNYKVKSNFESRFTGAKNVVWSATDAYLKASFSIADENVEAFFDGEGDLIGLSRKVDLQKLPLNAIQKIKKEYASYKVSEAIEFDRDGDKAYFLSLEDGTKKQILEVSLYGAVSKFKGFEK